MILRPGTFLQDRYEILEPSLLPGFPIRTLSVFTMLSMKESFIT